MPYPSKRVWIVGCIALAACVGLAAAGVSIRSESGPTCQRGDQNMARLSLG